MMRSVLVLLLSFYFLAIAAQSRADVNVLIIGSTRDSGEMHPSNVWWWEQKAPHVPNSIPFSPTAIGTQLQNILAQDGRGTVNVTVLNRYRSDAIPQMSGWSAHSYNLATWFHYPYPAGSESNRWANLRGETGTNWNYVVLIGDPYTMEYTPGMYAHGVAKIAEEVSRSTNAVKPEVVLLMPWPGSGSSSSTNHYKEVVYRTGRSGGFKVAPAGLAWGAIKGSARTNPNPDNDGAYIAASSIYSCIYTQSAKASAHVYNDGYADTAYNIFTNNNTASHYIGAFSFQNPYRILDDKMRHVRMSERGTSTEEGFKGKIRTALTRSAVTYAEYNDSYTNNTPTATVWTTNPMPISFNYGRDGFYSEPEKSYVINPSYWQLGFGYYYQNGGSHPVETFNDIHIALMQEQDNDLANRMINEAPTARNIPTRSLWAQIHKAYPSLSPMRDTVHLSYNLDEAVGTYIYTIYSGRCPLDPKPATDDIVWTCRRIGYETAWRAGRCQTRAPGFKVMPSAANVHTVTQLTKGTNTVQFILPPRSNVTVNVSVDNTAAVIVNPHTLVFTTNNYDTAQTVIFTGLPGLALNDAFSVQFRTSSGDEVYSGLYDEWAYTNKRTVTQATVISEKGTNSVSCDENTPRVVASGVAGIASSNTVFAGPANGTVVVSGSDFVYTPNLGYLGLDSFAYAVNSGGTVSRGYVAISVVPSSKKSVAVLSAQGGANPGSMITNSGTALSFFITNSPSISGGTIKYVASGGSVAGNSYTQVNPTNITLTLTNSCTLTWAWTTNYWLAVSTSGSGSVNVTNAWHASGTSVVVTATASNLWVFTGWSGATSGCSIAGNVITAPMTSARSITATFVQPFPVVSNSAGAISQTESSAMLQGVLTAGIAANGYFCWGAFDAGTAGTGSWQNVISVGAVTQSVVFARSVTGLGTNVTYWFRSYATNANGSAWSASASTFNGTPSMGGWAPWSPTQATNVGLWLDADDASKVLLNGGTVSNWLDKSGYNRHASQATAASQPTDTAAGLNGKHVLTFDGSTDFLNVDLDFLAGVSHSAFIVTKPTTYNNIYGAANGNSGANSLHVGFSNASNYRMNYWTHDWNGAISANFQAGQANILNYVWDVGSPKQIFANGASEGNSGGQNAGAIGTMAGGGRIVNVVGQGYFGGDIGEIIICTGAVSVADRQLFEGYLANKWGLAGNLPDGHPYKSQAPGISGDAINNRVPTGITGSGATLNAALSAAGTNYAVYVYWGVGNGGTNTGAWANSALAGAWTNVSVNVSYAVTNLQPLSYYYTFKASNNAGIVWSDASWRFAVPGAGAVTSNHSVPHAWLESQNTGWTNNFEAWALADPDGDGFSNWEEYWSGTNPQGSNSYLKIDAVRFDGTNVELEWQNASIAAGIPPIVIQATTDLATGAWFNAGQKAPVNGTNAWSETASQMFFYRLVVPSAP